MLEIDGVQTSQSIVFNSTGGWQSWTNSLPISILLNQGIHKLKFRIGVGDFNLNYVQISESVSTGINASVSTAASAYPTLFHDQTSIRVATPNTVAISMQATDSRGVEVYNSTSHITNESISFGKDLAPGLYIIRIVYEDKVETVKVVKQ